jgi:hypothetical protein
MPNACFFTLRGPAFTPRTLLPAGNIHMRCKGGMRVRVPTLGAVLLSKLCIHAQRRAWHVHATAAGAQPACCWTQTCSTAEAGSSWRFVN